MKANKFSSTYLILLVLLLSGACKKDPDLIGLDVQPASDRLNVVFYDSLAIKAWSELDDSSVTSHLSSFMVGALNDPIFGKTGATVYTQLLLSKNQVSFGDNAQVDSFILILPYKGYYGDTNTRQTIYVHQLSESISRDSTYYSNQSKGYSPNSLTSNPAGYGFYPQPNTKISMGTASLTPQIRIPLSNTFAQQYFIPKSGQPELSDNSNFTAYFKGLCIRSPQRTSNGGNLLYLDATDGASKAVLYYHNNTDTALSFEFSIRKDSGCFVGITHGYKITDPLFQQEVIQKDSSKGNLQLFVQPGGGVRTLIKFPNIKEYFATSRVIINEAELVIPAYETFSDVYTPPAKLVLARKGGDGKLYFLSDNSNPTGDDPSFGGYYDASHNEYRFRIKKYLQQIIDGLIEDYGLYLRVSGSSVFANRLLINGTAINTNRMRVKLTYTRIN